MPGGGRGLLHIRRTAHGQPCLRQVRLCDVRTSANFAQTSGRSLINKSLSTGVKQASMLLAAGRLAVAPLLMHVCRARHRLSHAFCRECDRLVPDNWSIINNQVRFTWTAAQLICCSTFSRTASASALLVRPMCIGQSASWMHVCWVSAAPACAPSLQGSLARVASFMRRTWWPTVASC